MADPIAATDQSRKLRLDNNQIPAELTALLNWVISGPEKIPYNAATGCRASPTDPADWGTFAAAVAAAAERPGWLPGVALTTDAGITCIDLDGCRDPETGEIAASAMRTVARFRPFAYIEVSRSGTGLHIFLRGTLPPGGRRRGKIEAYDNDRYLVVTSNVFGSAPFVDRTADLAAWHAETFPAAAPAAPIRPPLSGAPLPLDDRALLDRCLRNAKFRALHEHGDAGHYGGDQSAADLGYVDIVQLHGGTPEQADALYRQSQIAREKWDQRRGQQTYGERTIARAYDGKVIPFDRPNPQLAGLLPPASLAATGTDDATGGDLPDDVATLKRMIVDLTRRIETAEQRVARAETRATEAEHRADMLSAVQSRTGGVIRNTKLRQERFTAVALSYQFANREATGDKGQDGLYPITVARVAEAAGVSEDTASKHIATLAGAGVLRKVTKWIPEQVDRETGEITGGHKRQFIGPVGNVVDFVDAVARLEPKRTKKDGTEDRGWGGAHPTCPDHPDAGAIKRYTVHCAECDRVLDQGEEEIAADPDAAPNPQLAGLLPPRGNHLITRNGAASHKTGAAGAQKPFADLLTAAGDSASPTAASWIRGSPAPPDRYTDVAGAGS